MATDTYDYGGDIFQIRERLLLQRMERLNQYMTEDSQSFSQRVSSNFAQRGIRAGSGAIEAETQRVTTEGLRDLQESLVNAQGQLDLLRAQEAQRLANEKAIQEVNASASANAQADLQSSNLANQVAGNTAFFITAGRALQPGKPTRYTLQSRVGNFKPISFDTQTELERFLNQNPAIAQNVSFGGGTVGAYVIKTPQLFKLQRQLGLPIGAGPSVSYQFQTKDVTKTPELTTSEKQAQINKTVEKQNIEARIFDDAYSTGVRYANSTDENQKNLALDLIGSFLRGKGGSMLTRMIQSNVYTPDIPDELLQRWKELQ